MAVPELKLENFAQVSLAIQKLLRQRQSHIVGLLSPEIFHMHGKPDETGLVDRMLIPCAGHITKIMAVAPGLKEKVAACRVRREPVPTPIQVTVQVGTEDAAHMARFSITEELGSLNTSLTIKDGDVVSVYATGELPSNLLFAAIFMPNVGDYKVERYLNDAVEESVSERIRNAANEGVPIRTQARPKKSKE